MVCPIPVATLEDSCALYLCICSIQKSNHSLQSKSSSVYNILEVQDQCENFIHTLSGPKVLSGVLCFRTTFMIKSSCPPSPPACWQKFIVVWGETKYTSLSKILCFYPKLLSEKMRLIARVILILHCLGMLLSESEGGQFLMFPLIWVW